MTKLPAFVAFLSLLVAGYSGGALAQNEDFCRVYAYEALDAAKAHYDSQCGGDENGRYSLDLAFHFNACMGWGGEALKWASSETNIRSHAFYQCKAQQAGVVPFPAQTTGYEAPRKATKRNFCGNYAHWALIQRQQASQQPCNMSGQNGRWDETDGFHREWCMGLEFYDAGQMSSEINTRSKQIVACQVAAIPPEPGSSGKPALEIDHQAGGGGAKGGGGKGVGSATKSATTVYDEPAGNEVAYLSQGDAVTIAACDENGWCEISEPQRGYVWGGDLDR